MHAPPHQNAPVDGGRPQQGRGRAEAHACSRAVPCLGWLRRRRGRNALFKLVLHGANDSSTAEAHQTTPCRPVWRGAWQAGRGAGGVPHTSTHQHTAQLLGRGDGPRAKGAGPPRAGWQRRRAGLCTRGRRTNHQTAPASQRRAQRCGRLGRHGHSCGSRSGGLGGRGLGQQAVQACSHEQRGQQRQRQPCE